VAQQGRRSWVSIATRTGVLVGVLLATGTTAAFAAAPKPGGLYRGSEPHCAASAGFTCEFLFRVSANGRSMSFVATHNVSGVWACNGGGGEAVLGPYKKPLQGQPVPAITIAPTGTFTGKQSFGSGQGKGSVVASGRFTGTGTTATIEFTLDPGSHSCVNGPLNLSLG
jgi:hypothetical protein